MLGIEQKKGNDEQLCGRMIAYARILPTPDAEPAEGDFRQFNDRPSKRERDRVVDAKFNNFLKTMEENGVELPENVDVDAMRERLHELSSMEVIPIPARIGNFSNEEDILKEDADIYYIGEFIGANQAHYCLTTLPIYYQAKYREQAKRSEMDMLNEMLSQFEEGDFVDTEEIQKDSEELFPKGLTLNTFMGDLSKLLNVRVIPFLLACESENEYNTQIQLFYTFMKGYPDQNDIKRIDKALRALRKQGDSIEARNLLELSCKRINAIYNEDSQLANELSKQIETIEK